MTESGKHRFRILLVVFVVLVGGVVLGTRVLDARERGAVEDAARDAATTYVDLVATGSGDDLERLWSMTAASDPAALRAAGELLVDAGERIEVVGVGEPESVEGPRAAYSGALEDFRGVVVRYRLAGTELRHQVVLGRLAGRSGTSVEDWRVAGPLTGSLGWRYWNPRATFADFYVAGHLQDHPDPIDSGEEPAQPLYPAVYDVELRRAPWFVSPVAKVPVGAGSPVVLQPMMPQATEATVRRTTDQVTAIFEACGTNDRGSYGCPARAIVEDAGVDVFDDRGWWQGLVKEPTITFDGTDFTVSGGVFRFSGPAGERRVRFSGTGSTPLSAAGGPPAVSSLRIEEVR